MFFSTFCLFLKALQKDEGTQHPPSDAHKINCEHKCHKKLLRFFIRSLSDQVLTSCVTNSMDKNFFLVSNRRMVSGEGLYIYWNLKALFRG